MTGNSITKVLIKLTHVHIWVRAGLWITFGIQIIKILFVFNDTFEYSYAVIEWFSDQTIR